MTKRYRMTMNNVLHREVTFVPVLGRLHRVVEEAVK
jgi:hypothetical protein